MHIPKHVEVGQPDEHLQDMILTCIDCKQEFVWLVGEQQFYKQCAPAWKRDNPTTRIGPPKRCKICRRKYKAELAHRKRVKEVYRKQQKRVAEHKPDMQRWQSEIEAGTQGRAAYVLAQSAVVVDEFANVQISPAAASPTASWNPAEHPQ